MTEQLMTEISIWNSGTCQATNLPTSDVAHVIDGGSLPHRVPWTNGQTFFEVSSKYVDHAKNKFLNPTVVFDGYENHSIKYITHMRRSDFHKRYASSGEERNFLVNKGNEQRFVTLLKDTFNANGIAAIQAEDDFDLLIVQAAVTKSDNKEVVVFGEDTDLLVLLCHHAKQNEKAVYFTSDKHVTTKPQKIWDISNTKSVIGKEMCNLVPLFIP